MMRSYKTELGTRISCQAVSPTNGLGTRLANTWLSNITLSKDQFDKMVITFWMYTVLGSVFVLTAAQNTCPTNWFTAEFTIVNNQLINASGGAGQLADTNGSYFRNVLGFTATQLAAEVQTARDYFNTRFGLNFPELDANGRAQFENATMSYFQIPFTHYVTVNRWIVNGNTRSRCIDAFNGGLQVTFSDTQILRGTYGGATGRTIPAGESLLYGYYRVDACPQQPILIRYESINPSRSTADGYFVSDNRLYTRTLGTGFEIAVFRLEPGFNGNPQLIHSRFYATLFFPNPPPVMGLN